MQVFVRHLFSDDVVLHKGMLVWVKSVDLELGDGPVPFLAYDDKCFYKQWGIEQTTACGKSLVTVLQCSSNAGIVAAVEAGLGVAIINRKYVTRGMIILTEGFEQPPEIAYVVRTSPRMRSKTVGALATEIKREVVEFPSL
jgi:DNA-binding transcriptional LysR family regulator